MQFLCVHKTYKASQAGNGWDDLVLWNEKPLLRVIRSVASRSPAITVFGTEGIAPFVCKTLSLVPVTCHANTPILE